MAASTGRVNVMALDASATSERAFDWYVKNYHAEGDTIVLLHIHQMPQLPAMGLTDGAVVITESYRETVDASLCKSKRVVKKFQDKCAGHNVKFITALKDDFHSPGQLICDTAKEHGASVIITGQRGLGAFKRMLLGSTSDYVLHHAHIPVIVVPPPEGH